MNTRSEEGGKIGGTATEVIQVSPQAPAARIEMHVNSARLIDGEVRTTLLQMAQASILQAQAIGFY